MRTLLSLLRKYNYVIVFIILETIALVLLSNHNSYQHSKLINANREITGRMYEKVSGSREYINLRKTNASLSRENALLKNQLERFKPLNDSSTADYKKAEYYFSPSKIVYITRHKQLNFITINKGRNQGIHSDMAVIGPEGIVGIVLESSANFSTIIPIINRDFRASVKTKSSNYAGILEWDGADIKIAQLHEIPYHAKIAAGDSIITSGYSAIFPEGLFVGRILSFSLQEGNFYNIEIELGTNFSNLFYVDVINNFKQEEQRKLEKETVK